MGMRLSVVKQSFFGPPVQYGRLVTRSTCDKGEWIGKIKHTLYEVFFLKITHQTRFAVFSPLPTTISSTFAVERWVTRQHDIPTQSDKRIIINNN